MDRYNSKHPQKAEAAPAERSGAERPDSAESGMLESPDQEARWSGLRPLVPGVLPVPCAYYDQGFLSQADANRMLSGLVGEHSEVVWAIGGQAAKRYTAVYCDDGLGEYAGTAPYNIAV